MVNERSPTSPKPHIFSRVASAALYLLVSAPRDLAKLRRSEMFLFLLRRFVFGNLRFWIVGIRLCNGSVVFPRLDCCSSLSRMSRPFVEAADVSDKLVCDSWIPEGYASLSSRRDSTSGFLARSLCNHALSSSRRVRRTAQIAELDSNVQEATAQRQQEKTDNTVAIADAKQAITAVRSAISVLKTFYAKAAKATSLLEARKGPGDDAPASFDAPYRGMGGASGGVMGMLDVILSDFVRLEEETAAEEETSAREFDSFSSESTKDRAAKADALDAASKTRISNEKALNSAQEDLQRTQSELGSAEEYAAERCPLVCPLKIVLAENLAVGHRACSNRGGVVRGFGRGSCT